MDEELEKITRQAASDVIAVYNGLRDALGSEDVAVGQRDTVAATLTVAVFNRIDQIAISKS